MAVTIGSVTEGNANAEEIKNNSPDSELYENNKKYLQGSLVKFNDKIYLAKRNVPSDVDLDNPYYWEIFMDAADSKRVDELFEKTGNLDELETESKDNLVNAINEAVLYTAQSLTEEQQAQARANIGADLSTKMDANNPVGTGSFSMNRKAGTVVGADSHAEGYQATASGNYSHAEGNQTTASGQYSHAEGRYTKASGDYSHAQGIFNIEDTSNTYADIIGNGTSDTARSNAATVDWKGNAWYAGDVYTGSTSGTNKDEGSKKLATEEYVNSSIAANSVLYTAQSLTEEQQAQARANIGAGTPYTLLQATAEAIGGVKADSAEAADTQPVRIGGDGKLYTAPGGTDISLGITSAAVGQIIKVKAIDASGKPTAWEAADMAGGGGGGLWEHICDITTTNEIDGGITISENSDGVPLSELQYNEIWVLAKMVGVSTNTNNWWVCTCGIHQKEGDELYLSRTNGASSGGTTATRYVSWYTFIRGGKAYWTDGANIDPYYMAGGNQAWLDNFLDKYTFDYFTDVTIPSDSTRVIGVDTEIRILGRRA